MLNWSLFKPRDLIVIAVIVLATRLAFMTAMRAIDGNSPQ